MHGIVRIAPIVPSDVPAVACLDAPSARGEEDLRAELALPWSRVWVAHEDGHGVVAFVVFWHVVDEVHLLNLATRAARRRQGIARVLMTAVVDYARQQGVGRVLLEVRRSNRAAVELYRALGFWAAGTRVRYYQDGEDAIEMSLSLNRETGAVGPGTDQVPIDE